MLSQPKSRKVAALLAFSGTVIPICGFHKFYMGQPWWGMLYILLSWTPIPRVASAIEGVWYLAQDPDEFNRNFNLENSFSPLWRQASPRSETIPVEAFAEQVEDIADAVRQLDRLRQEGLLSEYEFEQKRRQLIDRIA